MTSARTGNIEVHESAVGPVIQFARFVDGALELFRASTTELEYIAVSHVFGDTSWHVIPGIKGDILASRSKARFIEKQLPALVGGTAFWMDILTVDQRDEAEVVSVVQAIPRIFRDALRTLAVREDDGFHPCCARAIGEPRDWQDFGQRLMDHANKHIQCIRIESYIQRLWTFQECLLSHTIDFVLCQKGSCLLLRVCNSN